LKALKTVMNDGGTSRPDSLNTHQSQENSVAFEKALHLGKGGSRSQGLSNISGTTGDGVFRALSLGPAAELPTELSTGRPFF
jgi:hypothetical protein